MEERKKYRRSLFSVLLHNIPGSRELVALLFGVLAIFLIAMVLSSCLFINAIQIGNYAEYVITSRLYLIVIFWVLIWLVSFLFALRAVLKISGRIESPIKRMEQFLDEVLNGKDSRIILREKDVLGGIAQRINKLLDLQKDRQQGD